MIMRGIRNIFRSIVLFALVAFSFTSCEEMAQDVSGVTVKVPIDRIVFNPQNNRVSSDFSEENYYQKEIDFDVDSLLDANGVNYLQKAELANLFLGVVRPENLSLSFLSSARVSVSKFEDFRQETIVAESENFNVSENEVEFMIHDVDVRSYLKSDVFYIRIYCDMNHSTQIEEATKLYVDGTLKVKME